MFKNWKMISGVSDPGTMWALVLLDIDSEMGRKLIERSPEYFTADKQADPVPVSMLRREANAGSASHGYSPYHDDLASEGACSRHNIPTRIFGGSGMHAQSGREPLPAELSVLNEVQGIGHVVEWRGGKIVVVENGLPEYIIIAPAELIAFDR